MIEREGRCGDEDHDCPICRADVLSEEFIARIEEAAAEPRIVQTKEEFLAWLDSL